CQQHHSYPRTF
nr:immunoglobulin light chain junction region [Macaca mulatta]MOW34209.1 immunoglobulin light chain junction region [Macaca mulatta]MOW34220.1 immunoglobulin light chain junction region [Macaca mulatta]MOW34242.1 immunoglobulin light chain junction region [Macaca mulatta]MOW34244.1 immunoglobulin light chain junction region [Macaca mulatta]